MKGETSYNLYIKYSKNSYLLMNPKLVLAVSAKVRVNGNVKFIESDTILTNDKTQEIKANPSLK